MAFVNVCIILLFTLRIRASAEEIEEGPYPVDPPECTNQNEEMSNCLMPEPCWKTCENMDNYVPCRAPCQPGCDCIPGFVRDEHGHCIHPQNCPQNDNCPKNQEIGCDSPCYPNTCENSYYTGPRRGCIELCILKCMCKPGWTFPNSQSKCCVPIEKCPICCARNREYKKCGSYNPPSCDSPHSEGEICDDSCNRGCFCKDGLVEDGYGNCIPPDNCPLRCGPNEIEDPCVNPCQPTCDDPYPPVCEFLYCNKGCVCAPPYIRDPVTNECVDRNNCIRHPCLQNESYAITGYDCKTCSNYQTIVCEPISQPKCICNDPNYVRDDLTGYCIDPADCPVID